MTAIIATAAMIATSVVIKGTSPVGGGVVGGSVVGSTPGDVPDPHLWRSPRMRHSRNLFPRRWR
jgi:hypothetical protein